jgi:hypothetical protein
MTDANVYVHQNRRVGDWLRSHLGLVSMWRAEYFDRTGGQAQKPIVIFAERIAVALEQVRANMGPACFRAKVTQFDSNTEAKSILVL